MSVFDAWNAFESFDKNQNGQVTAQEIVRLLDSKSLYISEKDARALVAKYDKDRDGQINYKEFSTELRPKSPMRGRP